MQGVQQVTQLNVSIIQTKVKGNNYYLTGLSLVFFRSGSSDPFVISNWNKTRSFKMQNSDGVEKNVMSKNYFWTSNLLNAQSKIPSFTKIKYLANTQCPLQRLISISFLRNSYKNINVILTTKLSLEGNPLDYIDVHT